MIGLVIAMEVEINKFLKDIKNLKTEVFYSKTFYSGKIKDKDVVLALSGVGKVNSAFTAAVMIEKFHPFFIINTGVAGGLQNVKTLDVVISTACVQHDFDTSPLDGTKRGFVSGIDTIEIPADNDFLSNIKNSNIDAHFGVVASGDQFIADSITVKRLITDYNALACEMEAAAVAHICLLANVKFIAVKVISDNGDEAAQMSFTQLVEIGSEKNKNTILNILQILK